MTKPIPAGLATLADFRPSAPPASDEAPPAPAPVRSVAEAHGFVERNPVVPRRRRRPVEEPTYSLRHG